MFFRTGLVPIECGRSMHIRGHPLTTSTKMFTLETPPPRTSTLFLTPLRPPLGTSDYPPRQVSTSFMEDPLGSETKVGLKLGFKTREVCEKLGNELLTVR